VDEIDDVVRVMNQVRVSFGVDWAILTKKEKCGKCLKMCVIRDLGVLEGIESFWGGNSGFAYFEGIGRF
jgi:hypothetical protein